VLAPEAEAVVPPVTLRRRIVVSLVATREGFRAAVDAAGVFGNGFCRGVTWIGSFIVAGFTGDEEASLDVSVEVAISASSSSQLSPSALADATLMYIAHPLDMMDVVMGLQAGGMML